MRIAAPFICTALLAALVAGCGGSADETTQSSTRESPPPASTLTAPAGARAQTCESDAVDATALRATGIACDQARQVMFAWQRSPTCAAAGASRSSCTAGGYRCLGAITDRGVAVSCAAKGRSISFTAKRG
jgi:hypothetical protein